MSKLELRDRNPWLAPSALLDKFSKLNSDQVVQMFRNVIDLMVEKGDISKSGKEEVSLLMEREGLQL